MDDVADNSVINYESSDQSADSAKWPRTSARLKSTAGCWRMKEIYRRLAVDWGRHMAIK